MSKARQTQCPSCKSTFQVNLEQLDVASGAVRCGNCLNVFQADDYFIDEDINPSSVIASTNNFYGTIEDDQDDVDESWALELLKELEDEVETDNEQAATSTPPSRGESAPPSVEAPVLPTLSKEKDVEEKKDELSNTFQNIDQWASNATHDQFGDFSDTPSSKESDSNKKNPDNEEWAKKILEEDELEQVAQANQDTSEAPESKVAPSNDQKNNIQATADPFGIGEELKDFVDKPEKPTANLDAKDVLATINLEPVELDLNSDGKKKVFHFIGETLLVLLATLLLGTQYLTYNFESLSKDPKLRPWYAKACATLNCTLPQQSDIKKIRGKNLVVELTPIFPMPCLWIL